MRPYLLSLPFLLSLACAAPERESAQSSEAAQSEAQSIKGIYSVPSSDPAIAAVAKYPVTVKIHPIGENLVRMHYDLPITLVGVKQEVEFIGPPEGTLTGDAGVAECSATPEGRVCNERFTNITVDVAAVSTAVNADPTLTAAQRTALIDASSDFAIDPVGVLTFTPKR